MPVTHIDSLEDPRLAPYRNLKQTNATRSTHQFIAEGDNLVDRLLASDFHVESLFLGERWLPRFATMASDALDILVVREAQIEEIVGFNFHRGILGCARRKERIDLRAFCQTDATKTTLAVCPDAQDPENLGALLQIGAATGVSALVLGPGCCDPLSRRVLRMSMGAALRMPIVVSEDLSADLTAIRDRAGVQLWASVAQDDGTPFDQIARPPRLALLFCSEGHGLGPEWLRLCSQRITIPMHEGTDSLNVAVAAGILLYHLSR